MSYQALARTWRPRNFSQLVGQSHVRTALENALRQQRLHPALLFSGTRGVGKTTLARIIAKCLNCDDGMTAEPCGQCSACVEIDSGRFVDLIEVDAASRTKVEETRELLDNVPYAPARGRVKVYLIDEVHMLSKSSFNALLKTLEEPPGHVQFLFATTDPQRLPITILSRCLQFHLKRIPPEQIAARMAEILAAEKIEHDEDGLKRLARAADGSLRDGLSLMDQAIAFGSGEVRGAAVAQMLGSIERRDLLALAEAVAARDATVAWAAIAAIDEQGLDFAEVLSELCRLWQRLALGQMLPDALDEAERLDLAPLCERFDAADLQVYYQIALQARRDLDWAPDPRSGFEMTILRTLAFEPVPASPDGGGQPRTRPEPAPAGPPAPAAASPAPKSAAAPQARSPAPVPAPDADWPELQRALQLPGAAQVVVDALCLEDRNSTRMRLTVGAEAANLCTPRVLDQVRRGLAALVGQGVSIEIQVSAPAVPKPAVAGQGADDEFLARPAVRAWMEHFAAQAQAGTLRVASDE